MINEVILLVEDNPDDETLARIRANERTRTLPVVMLTTSDEGADMIRSHEAGVNSYVRGQ